MREMPHCQKCGGRHWNVQPCSKAQQPPDYLRRQPAPDGYRYSSDWGVKTKSVPLVYTLPPQPSHGRILAPDGTVYTPQPPEAA